MNTDVSCANLIAEFIAQGETETAAWRKQDIRRFNRQMEKMGETVERIKSTCPGGLIILRPLMSYDDPFVQLYAAYYSIDVDRAQAMEKIRSLSHRGIARIHAFTLLQYLQEGGKP